MPFVSQAQRRWMYENKPEMAKEWESKTPKGAKLPQHVNTMKKAIKEEKRIHKSLGIKANENVV